MTKVNRSASDMMNRVGPGRTIVCGLLAASLVSAGCEKGQAEGPGRTADGTSSAHPDATPPPSWVGQAWESVSAGAVQVGRTLEDGQEWAFGVAADGAGAVAEVGPSVGSVLWSSAGAGVQWTKDAVLDVYDFAAGSLGKGVDWVKSHPCEALVFAASGAAGIAFLWAVVHFVLPALASKGIVGAAATVSSLKKLGMGLGLAWGLGTLSKSRVYVEKAAGALVSAVCPAN